MSASQIEFEDRERVQFLRKLDDSTTIEVTDWEAQFISDFLERPRPFTAAQRTAVDVMIGKYGGRL
jgi:hypothetical protein